MAGLNETENLHDGMTRTAAPGAAKMRLKGALMVLIALPFGFFMFTTVADKLQYASWPATRAEVLELETHGQAKSSAQCLQLRYRYVVDGKAFVADRMTVARSSLCYRDKTALAALMQRYQPGAPVWIRYDPSHPRKAAIYPDELGLIDVLFCLLAIILGAAGAQLLRRPVQPIVGCPV